MTMKIEGIKGFFLKKYSFKVLICSNLFLMLCKVRGFIF